VKRLLVAVVLAVALQSQAAAQTGLVLQGRIVEAGTSFGIQNAVVAIGGFGSVLTTADGAFRFGAVGRGTHELRVTALGYATSTRLLTVDASMSVTIALEVVPLPLSPLTFREIELEGRVRDGRSDIGVGDADVSTEGGRNARTNANGRFTVDAFDGVAVEMRVRAFGYLPLDTGVVAREDERPTLLLAPDPIVDAIIADQVQRLETRSRPQRAILFRNLDRDRLVRYAGRHTLLTMLEAEYGHRLRGRIKCVVLDEFVLHPDVDGATLATTFPEDVERVEFLYSGNMLRVYTRRFLFELAGRNTKLRQPTYVQPPRGLPFCI
jgi:hypothetical protein